MQDSDFPDSEKAKNYRDAIKEVNEIYDQLLDKDSERARNQKAFISNLKQELKDAIKKGQATEEEIKLLREKVIQAELFLERIKAEQAAEGLADSFSNIFAGADGFKLEDALNPRKND